MVLSVTPPDPNGWVLVNTGSLTLTDTSATGKSARFYRLEVANP